MVRVDLLAWGKQRMNPLGRGPGQAGTVISRSQATHRLLGWAGRAWHSRVRTTNQAGWGAPLFPARREVLDLRPGVRGRMGQAAGVRSHVGNDSVQLEVCA